MLTREPIETLQPGSGVCRVCTRRPEIDPPMRSAHMGLGGGGGGGEVGPNLSG